ncbi:hypothetical protein OV079_45260 [Nannocystis pusilla]|uniref:Uncharacterized protein n=1 Tax=Nannocystis pusilla TaxID=889268 RepID=A0A9X3J2F9_9BACT|nr:hypothetical protein [Nannocystis pusilla]MCY1012626.1 hypothetical protein [Nannocystis pusilla]
MHAGVEGLGGRAVAGEDVQAESDVVVEGGGEDPQGLAGQRGKWRDQETDRGIVGLGAIHGGTRERGRYDGRRLGGRIDGWGSGGRWFGRRVDRIGGRVDALGDLGGGLVAAIEAGDDRAEEDQRGEHDADPQPAIAGARGHADRREAGQREVGGQDGRGRGLDGGRLGDREADRQEGREVVERAGLGGAGRGR